MFNEDEKIALPSFLNKKEDIKTLIIFYRVTSIGFLLLYLFLFLRIELLQGFPWLILFQGYNSIIYILTIVLVGISMMVFFHYIVREYFKKRLSLKEKYSKQHFKILFPESFYFLSPFLFINYYPRNWLELIIWSTLLYLLFFGPRVKDFYLWKNSIHLSRRINELNEIPFIISLKSDINLSLLQLIFFGSLGFQLLGLYPLIPFYFIFLSNGIVKYLYIFEKKEYLKRMFKFQVIYVIIFLSITIPIILIGFNFI